MTDRITGPGRSRRTPRRLLPPAVALVAAAAIALVGTASTDGTQSTPVAAAGAASPDAAPKATPSPAASPAPAATPTLGPATATEQALLSRAARPIALRIPSIGVDAPLIELGLNPDRTLEVPTDTVDAGWYGLGPRPGEPGPAVIAGHVDSKAGPGVFFRLRDLEPGARVEVAYDDGSTVAFEVTEVVQYAKDAFPTRRIYGNTADPELRLITCGGSFDRDHGHYRDNVVAFATHTGPRRDAGAEGGTPPGW